MYKENVTRNQQARQHLLCYAIMQIKLIRMLFKLP